MLEVAFVINVATCIWILFFDGAARIENSLPGYLEFGSRREILGNSRHGLV
jgi:hypothetical protein